MLGPTYNHTRGDSHLTPCPTCKALQKKRKKKAPPFMIHKVPTELKARFKQACRASRISMRGQIIHMMSVYAAASGY